MSAEQLLNAIKNANLLDLKSLLNTENVAALTGAGDNILHLVAFHGKKAAGDLIKAIMSVGKVDPNKQNINGITPLAYSVIEENLEAFKSLITLPGTNLDISDRKGTTILEHSLDKKPELITGLVKMKCKCNIVGSNGLPLVCLAVMNKNIHATEQLLKGGADKASVDKDGNNLIMLSVINQDYKMLKMLLSYGVLPDVKNILGDTPLIMAAAKGSKEILLKIIKTKRININGQGNNGLTALHWAAMQKSKVNQDLLISWYARKDIKDSAGKTYADYL